MVGGKALDQLQARKQILVLESRLNRLALEADWQALLAATRWARSAGQTVRQVRPWLLLLAPLAGLLAGRGSGRTGGLVSRLLSVLKWIRPLLGAWGSLKEALAEVQPRPPAQS